MSLPEPRNAKLRDRNVLMVALAPIVLEKMES